LTFSHGNNKSILILDDELDLSNVIERWLLIHRFKPNKFIDVFPDLERFNSDSKAPANVIPNIKKYDAKETKTIKQKKRGKDTLPKCAFSCGRIATGFVQITEITSLQLCDTCHRLFDPDGKMTWISF
jgi:hypothetical protein